MIYDRGGSMNISQSGFKKPHSKDNHLPDNKI